jgi:8-oxo-dGTP pyrophosphatase MutT (NUDIX family)
MGPDLAAFLARHRPSIQDSTVWGNGALPLRITAYLGQEPPPLAYVTSVRGIVVRDGMVLVLRNRDALHIVPGGRRKTGETLEETLRREVLEETGWTLDAPTMLGFMHFHHLSPKPPDYPYPHPDFTQIVYVARADAYLPDARIADDYEIESGFCPPATVHALALTPSERLYLGTALEHGST